MPQTYYARFASNGIPQALAAHLRAVAGLAQSFARAARPGDDEFPAAAFLAGLLHDLGKYRDEFQAYLIAGSRAKKSTETAHSVYGAAAACHRFQSEAIAFAIAGHHAGLHDASKLQQLMVEPANRKKFDAENRFPALLGRAQVLDRLQFPNYEPQFGPDPQDAAINRSYEFFTRMLFSILVDADRLDSERWDKEQLLNRPWKRQALPLDADYLLQRLKIPPDQSAPQGSWDLLTKIRREVFEACLSKGESSPQGFFTLTVPTGGGKTRSSMAFALAHARRHKLRRVIVVIPYLSIIEQNAKVYRNTFGPGYILEHHSAVEIPNANRLGRAEAEDDPRQASNAEKAIENWDAPIIVTTSVQFLETLFAASTKRARKLHNIAQSVVIFDEVQTLPCHLLEPTLDAFRELKNGYGVSFLFCSATQPAFRQSSNLKQGFQPGEVQEVAPEPATLFRNLQRVNYRIAPMDDKWDWLRLSATMLGYPRQQALCVVNLRRQAFEAWQTFRQILIAQGREDDLPGVFHLSSAMCPAHRLDVLGLSKAPPPNNIKARLKDGQPCWVLSTQLIECGVDVDFPVVFRALGPLDSIVQAAGRCNREGALKDAAGNLCHGEVVVFCPEDDHLPLGIYADATRITPKFLEPALLVTDPAIFCRYFTELFGIASTDHVKKGEHTIQQDRSEFNYRKVADRAKVIKEDTTSVIAPYREAKKLIRAIRKNQRFDRTTLRRLQRFMVSLRAGPNSDLQKLEQLGALQPLLPELPIPVLGDWCYSLDQGVVIENRPAEDFIQ